MLDMTGQRFGRLLVLERGENRRSAARWICRCACGATTIVIGTKLRNGQTTSCRCWQRDLATSHGHARRGRKTNQYLVWVSMLARCSNPTNKAFKNYGGRGITVCDHWRRSYAAFLFWVGPRPSPAHSIDRIDNEGNYEPGNVRWATRSEQRANQRPRRRKGATA